MRENLKYRQFLALSFMKFLKILRPLSVSMLSGWNCTPQMGSCLCFTPMISPSSVSAVISRQAGSTAFDHQRMVAGAWKRVWHPFEQILAVVLNQRGFPVHHAVIDDDISAEHVADALVAKANAQGRNFWTECADDFV